MARGGVYTGNARGAAGLQQARSPGRGGLTGPSRTRPGPSTEVEGAAAPRPRAAAEPCGRAAFGSTRMTRGVAAGGPSGTLCESAWEREMGFRAQPRLHACGFCPPASPGQHTCRGRLSRRFPLPPRPSPLQTRWLFRRRRASLLRGSRSRARPAPQLRAPAKPGRVPRPARHASDTSDHCPVPAAVQRDTSWWYCAPCSWGLPYT